MTGELNLDRDVGLVAYETSDAAGALAAEAEAWLLADALIREAGPQNPWQVTRANFSPVYARAQLSCWYPPIPGAWRQSPATGGGGVTPKA